MPSVAIVVVTTVRVRRVAIACGRRVAIARGRHRCHGPSRPLGRPVPLPSRRLHCLSRRACATCAFARPVTLLCQRWRVPGWIKGPACAVLWSGRTGEELSRPWPLLGRPWLAPSMAMLTTSTLLSTSRLFSRRKRQRRRASTLRAFWGVALMRTGGRQAGPRPWHAIRVRVAFSKRRGPALALATLAVATRVVLMRRRSSGVHC